jgi:hypothetical protein
MIDDGAQLGWSEERRSQWRIEKLLEKEIKLLERISSQLPPATYDAPGSTATMEFV